jgi:hypothetical protein
MSLPRRLIPTDSGVYKLSNNVMHYLDDDSDKPITLRFTEGRKMVISYDGQDYIAESIKLVVPTQHNYLFYHVDPFDARLKDVFQTTKTYVKRCHANHGNGIVPLYFVWGFTHPLTIQGCANVTGINVSTSSENAISEMVWRARKSP